MHCHTILRTSHQTALKVVRVTIRRDIMQSHLVFDPVTLSVLEWIC